MGVLVVALLLVAAADRQPRRLDDHYLTSTETCLSHAWIAFLRGLGEWRTLDDRGRASATSPVPPGL